jgi:hypothetical protein
MIIGEPYSFSSDELCIKLIHFFLLNILLQKYSNIQQSWKNVLVHPQAFSMEFDRADHSSVCLGNSTLDRSAASPLSHLPARRWELFESLDGR